MVGWLIDTFTAASTIGVAGVAVHCGPDLTGDFSPLALYVAVNDPAALATGNSIDGATSNQNWVGAGSRKKDEQLSVYCTAEAWTGDTGTRAAMVACYGIVAAAEDILRTQATGTGLGGAAQIVEIPGSTGHTLRWIQAASGLAAHVLFRVDVHARIGT